MELKLNLGSGEGNDQTGNQKDTNTMNNDSNAGAMSQSQGIKLKLPGEEKTQGYQPKLSGNDKEEGGYKPLLGKNANSTKNQRDNKPNLSELESGYVPSLQQNSQQARDQPSQRKGAEEEKKVAPSMNDQTSATNPQKSPADGEQSYTLVSNRRQRGKEQPDTQPVNDAQTKQQGIVDPFSRFDNVQQYITNKSG